MLTVLLESTPFYNQEINSLQETYAAFINYAFDENTRLFRNTLSLIENGLKKKVLRTVTVEQFGRLEL